MPYNVYLKKGEEKRIIEGHPWIYANEVLKVEGKDKQGSIARVMAYDGRFIGQGFINHLSKIMVRILTRDEREIDAKFFRERIEKAWKLRKEFIKDSNACRVVFGEADGLPGLVVDKYAGYLSVQILTLGMDCRKETLIEILKSVFEPLGIYERSDVPVRLKEGLEEYKGLLYGEVPELIEISENGLRLAVDIINGQKTGYFLDQKDNRAALAPYCRGKRVIDCFSHTGGFALNALKAGASEVTAVDISDTAVANIRRNAELNGFAINTVTADVFEYLRDLRRGEEKRPEVIVLDPPAFAKSRDSVDDAVRGYRDINVQAMKLLKNGGVLFTCSCSHFITVDMFLDMLRSAALGAGVEARLLELRIQCLDHSALLSSEESMYLKCAVLYVS